jgi:hypothetical protein
MMMTHLHVGGAKVKNAPEAALGMMLTHICVDPRLRMHLKLL